MTSIIFKCKGVSLIIVCLTLFFLSSCQVDNLNNDKKKMYITSVVQTLFSESEGKIESISNYDDLLKLMNDRYGEYMTNEALEKNINNGTFIQFEQVTLDLVIKVEVKEIEIKETSDKNYYFIAELSVSHNETTSDDSAEGTIQFNDEGKINYLNITKKPNFFDDYINNIINRAPKG